MFKKIIQFFKRLFSTELENEVKTVEIKQLSKLPKEIKKVIPKNQYKHFEAYSIKFKWKQPKIRGKFKPKTAHEKRLWKPNAKLEEN